ncbi:MAG TPA: histidine kinase dimerization/phospho-acceptor domain-containing protein [Candidatus Margulisiibacteriota bacterium]|nr:histidine kinase dimerization/phospho-acceptor domain-containing protein [Candidatus Margulisiibacteriota bacterium]
MEQRAIDRKRTVILLRSVVVISTSFLILFGEFAGGPARVGYILALVASNVLLASTPKEWFHQPWFSAALLLADTAVVLTGLYLTVGCFSQDFLIIYFFTIFLTTATESIAPIAVGTAMTDDGALRPGREEFCKGVATIAANALSGAEQAGAHDATALKEEFLSTLSHELRTPLNVILGNADIIADEVQGVASPLARDSIDRLRASALHLTAIIEELLCFTELRAGHAAVYAEHVTLQDLFDEFRNGSGSAREAPRAAARAVPFRRSQLPSAA